MASASIHTQNFNSANLRLTAGFKPVDWLVLSARHTLPLYAHAFSGDANAASCSFSDASAVLRLGSAWTEKERVTVSSSSSEYGGVRTHSSSYFEADMKVYSYVGLRGGLCLQNMVQPINAARFDIAKSDETARIVDTNWTGETRVTATGLHAGIEWGRDSHANVEFEADGDRGRAQVCYNARYYLDFLYMPDLNYHHFSSAGSDYAVQTKADRSYTQLGGRFGFEQNFRWWTWGAELGLQRRFGDGESTKLSENGYGYLNFFFGFSIANWASAE